MNLTRTQDVFFFAEDSHPAFFQENSSFVQGLPCLPDRNLTPGPTATIPRCGRGEKICLRESLFSSTESPVIAFSSPPFFMPLVLLETWWSPKRWTRRQECRSYMLSESMCCCSESLPYNTA